MSESKQRRYDWVTFTSDYGLDDVFVGVCKGVIAQIAPHVRIVDVCHLITAQDVEQGATSLSAAMPYLPVGIHLALVDPMHGSSCRGVVIETVDGSLLVGPDNGILSLAWDERGGIKQAVEVVNPAFWRETVHRTFRGRDVFAPVAAHLANGQPLSDVGPSVDPAELARLPVRGVIVDDDHVHAEVSQVDHFGNVSLNLHARISRLRGSPSETPWSCAATAARSPSPSPRPTGTSPAAGSPSARTPSGPSCSPSTPDTPAVSYGCFVVSRS